MRKQIEGFRSITSKPVTGRLPTDGPITFGRGLELSLQFDESAFEGAGVFLLGAVLERFFDGKRDARTLLRSVANHRTATMPYYLQYHNCEKLGWAPGISLQDGLEKTYRWIYDQMTADDSRSGTAG